MNTAWSQEESPLRDDEIKSQLANLRREERVRLTVGTTTKKRQDGAAKEVDEPTVTFPDGRSFGLIDVQRVCLQDASMLTQLSNRGIDLDWLSFPHSLSGSRAGMDRGAIRKGFDDKVLTVDRQTEEQAARVLAAMRDSPVLDQELAASALSIEGLNALEQVTSVLGCFSRSICDLIEDNGGCSIRVVFDNADGKAILIMSGSPVDLECAIFSEARHGSSADNDLICALSRFAIHRLRAGECIIPGIGLSTSDNVTYLAAQDLDW